MHIHHFGPAALALALSRPDVPFIFTPRSALEMNAYPISVVQSCIRRTTIKAADAVIALSLSEARFLCSYWKLEPENVVTIPNALPPDTYRPDPAIARVPDSLLFVGQLNTKLKGIDILVQAMRIVRDQRPSARLKLAYHNVRDLTAITALVRRESLYDAFDFLGATPPSSLARLYRECAVLVLPSRSECYPNVILEALASGMPVVASGVGGIPEQVKDGSGLIVTPGDPRALAEAILRVLRYREQYATAVAAGLHQLTNHHSVERLGREHLRVYTQVLEKRRNPPISRRLHLGTGLLRIAAIRRLLLKRWTRGTSNS